MVWLEFMEYPQNFLKKYLKKYAEKAEIILERDGFSGLLLKIREKIWHILTHRIFFFLRPDYIKQRIKQFLERPRPIDLPTSPTPLISVIVYVDDSALYTYRCLKSINDHISGKTPLEIILINDSVNPKLDKFLKQVSGINITRNQTKIGKLKSYNLAVANAKGKFIYFLDRDCYLLENSIDSLLSVIQNNPDIGIVGSKQLYENRSLKSAGGIVWSDGKYCEYGNGDRPEEPEYNYLRPVDYCAMQGLLVRQELFHQLGCFSEVYASDIYVAVDLCFAARQLNYQTIYQPKSVLIDRCPSRKPVELNSTIPEVISSDPIDRSKFIDRWSQALTEHLPEHESNLELNLGLNSELAARRLRDRPVILIIDTLVPAHDKDSGSYRLFNIISILKSLDYQIIFLPDYGHEQEPYTSELENLGIEVLCHTNKQSNSLEMLKKRLPIIDLAWVCRPELCEKYFTILRQKPQIKIIYDTIDLHFVRLKRQWEFTSQVSSQTASPSVSESHSNHDRIEHKLDHKTSKSEAKAWQEMQVLEIKYSQLADTTIVVTDIEKNILDGFHANQVQVVPNIHQVYDRPITKFVDRHDLLFIGGYYHTPNVDAVIWLCEKIMPLVWAVQPEIKLTLLGSNPPPTVKALANHRVAVPGYIKDVEPYFLNHRLFIAPLRYGAGMKGKIGHSLSYGLPTVTTAIGAEGMGLVSGFNALIANELEVFVTSILTLYNDEALWHHISQNSIKVVEQYSPQAVKSKLAEIFDSLLSIRA